MQYEVMSIVLRTEERRRERERESEGDLSIYSMGDYPHVGCHLTFPTLLNIHWWVCCDYIEVDTVSR
jgi:hypothetical protein